MENNFFGKNKMRVFWGAAVLAGVLLFVWVWNKPQKLSPDFLAARGAAAEISQQIVSLTGVTSEKIKAVNIAEVEVEYTLKLIQEARESNAEAYTQAFNLSQHLQKIAELLNKIKSRKSQRLAYEAVSVELGLISELLAYTERLNKFLDGLAKVIINRTEKNQAEADQYLKEVNNKVAMINNLNKEFLKKIRAFDESF